MSQVSDCAKLGSGVKVGAFTIIHGNVVIGDGCVIDSHCVIGQPAPGANGRPLSIGNNARIRSHSVLYEGATLGDHLNTGHGILVREGCDVGAYVQIGSRSEIIGPCRIGDYTRLHSEVHIGEGTDIGRFVWLFPRINIPNDPFPPSNIRAGVTIRDMAVVALGSILLPGVTIGVGAFVGAASVVGTDVADIHCVSGNPARVFATLGRFRSLKHNVGYPWPDHFRRGYPESSYPEMDALKKTIEELIDSEKKTRRRV